MSVMDLSLALLAVAIAVLLGGLLTATIERRPALKAPDRDALPWPAPPAESVARITGPATDALPARKGFPRALISCGSRTLVYPPGRPDLGGRSDLGGSE